MSMDASDVLYVINGCEHPDMSEWEFCVIVGRQEDDGKSLWPFEKGELLVLNANGREPFGEGRKPYKWAVETAEFSDLDEALACRAAVLAGTWVATS